MTGRGTGVLLLISFCFFFFLLAHTSRSQSKASSAPPVSSTPSLSAKAASGAKKSPPEANPAQKLSPAAAQWVETALGKMTLDEKVGQLIFATYHGSFTATD